MIDPVPRSSYLISELLPAPCKHVVDLASWLFSRPFPSPSFPPMVLPTFRFALSSASFQALNASPLTPYLRICIRPYSQNDNGQPISTRQAHGLTAANLVVDALAGSSSPKPKRGDAMALGPVRAVRLGLADCTYIDETRPCLIFKSFIIMLERDQRQLMKSLSIACLYSRKRSLDD